MQIPVRLLYSRRNATETVPMHYGDVVGSPSDGGDFAELLKKAGTNIQVELML